MRQLAFIVVLVGVVSCLPTYPYHNVYPDVYPVHPGGIGGIFKGPGSETIIKGPDGSVITSEQKGGLVAVKPEVVATAPIVASAPLLSLQPQPVFVARQPIVVPQPHPILVAQPRPVIVDRAPIIVAEESPKIVAEHVLVGHKVITVPKQVKENSDLVGPSGTISIRGDDAVISGPASLTVKGDGVIADISKEPLTTVIKSAPVLAKTIVQETVVLPAPAVLHASPILTHSIASPAIVSGPKVLIEGPSAPSAVVAGPSVGPAVITGPRVASAAVIGPRVGPAFIDGPRVAPALVAGYAQSAPVLSHNVHYRPIVRPDTILTGAYEASLALPAATLPRDLVAATYGSSYLPHGNAAGYYAKPVYRGVL